MTDNPADHTDARRALLEGLVDYAGLFPPAALSMTESVRAYDEYRRGPQAWALGKFVVPVGRLAEFENAAAPFLQDLQRDVAWPLSLLAGADFGADIRTIEEFARRAGPRVSVGAIEVKAATPAEIAAVARDAALLRTNLANGFEVYVEIPVATDPGPLVGSIASHGLRAKVRTGGVEAGAFPTSAQLARFLAVCVARGVTFKATAGLHHAMRGTYPLTYDSASERGMMFGFLNVFLAALFVHDGLGRAEAAELLEERDPRAFAFSGAGVTWRGRTAGTRAIRAARARAATSFGSCSFTEPVTDLSALGLL